MSRRCPRGEAGFAGGFGALLFGTLLFVVGTLMVATAWSVVDTKMAAVAAARQGARAFVEAADPASGSASAVGAADATLSGWGRDPALAEVSVSGGGFARCSRVTVEVSYPAPTLALPLVGRVGASQRVRADHSELVDPYRSGLAGAAGGACG